MANVTVNDTTLEEVVAKRSDYAAKTEFDSVCLQSGSTAGTACAVYVDNLSVIDG